MIKPYWNITLRDYNIMERTGNVSQLKCPWNILPVFLFNSIINKRLKSLSKILNTSNVDEGKDNLIWKTESLIKINLIEASYLGILNLLELGTKIISFRPNIAKWKWNKIKLSNNNLSKYINNIKNYTGIEIKELADLKNVLDELTFRKDKFNENFNKKVTETKKVYLMSVALGVFSYLNQSLNVDMTVVEFAAIREDAYKRMETEKNKS